MPARDAEPEMDQPAIGRGHLEAHPLHREGAVTAALSAGDFHAEGTPERRGARTLAADVGAFEVALEGSLAELAVESAVILLLDPRLGRPVEQFEGELRLAFEHRHQSPLDTGPEVLLFGILLRTIRQRQILEDAESLAALVVLAHDDLLGRRGRRATRRRRIAGHTRARRRRAGAR